MKSAVRIVLMLVQVPLALMVLYLDLLTIAAARRRRRLPMVAPGARFAVLIPAHDEELLLPRLLASCAALSYPRDLFDIHIVADNCSDRTAALARQGGAITHERCEPGARGKGHALRWLLGELERQQLAYDAYVIVDADSVVAPNLLTVFNAHLAAGHQAVQCFYGVLNPNDAWLSQLRYIAMLLFNGLRPRGRDSIGLSAGLRGNGMCFAADLVQRFGWGAFSLAEDAEYHLLLVDGGVCVHYAGETRVMSEMPTSLRQAQSQNLRWERGRLQLLRKHGPGLAWRALRQRDGRRFDALAEQFVPPLSVFTGLTVCTYLGTVALRLGTARRLAGLILCGQAAYVIGGMRLTGAQPRAYLALLLAPPYVAWKAGVYAQAALGRTDWGWVRTARRQDAHHMDSAQ